MHKIFWTFTLNTLNVKCFATKKKSFAVQSAIFFPKKFRNVSKFLQDYAASHPTR